MARLLALAARSSESRSAETSAEVPIDSETRVMRDGALLGPISEEDDAGLAEQPWVLEGR